MQQTTTHPPSHLSGPLLSAVITATVLAGSIAGIGMAASFHTVSAEMTPGFGRGWAWTVPATLDLTVASFSLLEVVLVRLSMPHLLAKMAVYAATAATVYLNVRVARGQGHAQQLAHAAMPAVWVIYIELLRGAAKYLALREQGVTAYPLARWALAPRTTFSDWRRSVLKPITQDNSTAGDGQFAADPQPVDEVSARASKYSDNSALSNPSGASSTSDEHDHAAGHPAFPTSRPPPGPGRGHSQKAVVLATAASYPGWSNTEIARHLDLSPRTVRRHRRGQ